MSLPVDQPSCSTMEFCSDSGLIKQILQHLKPLDELLKCHICFDYFNTCVITKCCHSYCSLCIRKYMMYKAQCPECFQVAVEPELRSNRQIDEVLRIYHEIQNMLKSTVVSKTEISALKDSLADKPKPIMNKTDNATSVSQKPESSSKSTNKVSCPNCSTLVKASDINSHLDMCLVTKTPPAKVQNHSKKREPLSKVVYHLLSDKEIRKRLRDNGLSSVGDRQSLIRRHKNFIVIYNAECDSLNPKPVADIIKQVEKDEQEFEKGTTSKLFQSSKKSSSDDIRQENESYIKQNSHQFDSLITQIKSRSSSKHNGKKKEAAENERNTKKDKDEHANLSNELVIESSEKSDDSGGNSPILFPDSESENENSNLGKTFNNHRSQDSHVTKPESSLPMELICCRHSSGSSDDFRICDSMKESKRFKRKIRDSGSPT